MPQASIEFDVDDASTPPPTSSAPTKSYTLLHDPVTMPWGQRIVQNALSPENLLVGLTYTPWMR